jgi:hypothetical protein
MIAFYLYKYATIVLLACLVLSSLSLAISVPHVAGSNPVIQIREKITILDGKTLLLSNATVSDIEAARQIVKSAIAKASKLNKARLDNPARN